MNLWYITVTPWHTVTNHAIRNTARIGGLTRRFRHEGDIHLHQDVWSWTSALEITPASNGGNGWKNCTYLFTYLQGRTRWFWRYRLEQSWAVGSRRVGQTHWTRMEDPPWEGWCHWKIGVAWNYGNLVKNIHTKNSLEGSRNLSIFASYKGGLPAYDLQFWQISVNHHKFNWYKISQCQTCAEIFTPE